MGGKETVFIQRKSKKSLCTIQASCVKKAPDNRLAAHFIWKLQGRWPIPYGWKEVDENHIHQFSAYTYKSQIIYYIIHSNSELYLHS